MFILNVKVLWIIIAIAFGVAEALTLSLTMVWFSIGAICALLTAYITDSLAIQIIVFAVVSFSTLYIATKKLIAMRKENKGKFWSKEETNFEAIINSKGYVVKTIRPSEPGLVKVRGEEWTAVSFNEDQVIELDQKVIVKKVEGVKLVVEQVENI